MPYEDLYSLVRPYMTLKGLMRPYLRPSCFLPIPRTMHCTMKVARARSGEAARVEHEHLDRAAAEARVDAVRAKRTNPGLKPMER